MFFDIIIHGKSSKVFSFTSNLLGQPKNMSRKWKIASIFARQILLFQSTQFKTSALDLFPSTSLDFGNLCFLFSLIHFDRRSTLLFLFKLRIGTDNPILNGQLANGISENQFDNIHINQKKESAFYPEISSTSELLLAYFSLFIIHRPKNADISPANPILLATHTGHVIFINPKLTFIQVYRHNYYFIRESRECLKIGDICHQTHRGPHPRLFQTTILKCLRK